MHWKPILGISISGSRRKKQMLPHATAYPMLCYAEDWNLVLRFLLRIFLYKFYRLVGNKCCNGSKKKKSKPVKNAKKVLIASDHETVFIKLYE